jgi:hypothetical protein
VLFRHHKTMSENALTVNSSSTLKVVELSALAVEFE